MQPSVTVTGNPGVGKTATMRSVALKMKEKGYTVGFRLLLPFVYAILIHRVIATYIINNK
jgi:Cdc6-like AAA superfamily ATPase